MQIPIYDVASLLPHNGKMILLNEITSYDEESLIAYAQVTLQQILVSNGIFPSWAAMEMMAQRVAAWAGILAKDAGEEVSLVFLLGTKKLQLFFDNSSVPALLRVDIKCSLQDNNGFGIFNSQLWHCDDIRKPLQLLAEAVLKVYWPHEDINKA